jgi:DNA-binding NtrC family response regulator
MRFQGVLYSRAKPPVRIEIADVGAIRETAGRANLPAVIAVRCPDLVLFAEHPELFVNRHHKDSRKGLARLFLGHGARFPFIEAKFASLGRLTQSAAALVKHAEERGEHGIYVIGVDANLFAEAWKRAPGDRAIAEKAANESGISRLLRPLPGESEVAKRYWGESSGYHKVRQYILYAAQNEDPVLILGETGTGKGIIAREIHERQRPNKNFVTVNCAAIPGELFEAELFGYVKGAFTGALSTGKMGQWERANGGTLFLDEIGDLRLDQQAKILHALHDHRILRLGGLHPVEISARIIAATNRRLWGMVQAGKFRADLYYRLRNFVILTPVLRDHPEDIGVIAQELWAKISHSDSGLPKEILDDLCKHRWPGNVRELRNVLGTLYNFFSFKLDYLTRDDLSAVFQEYGLAAAFGLADYESTGPDVLRTDCLRKIMHADETIHACEEALKGLMEGGRLTASERKMLTRLLIEVRDLLQNRLLFGSHGTYEAVGRVEAGLERLLKLPSRKAGEISEYFHSYLESAISAAIEELFAEMERLRELPGTVLPKS